MTLHLELGLLDLDVQVLGSRTGRQGYRDRDRGQVLVPLVRKS
jgi:hypothetical protein